MAGRGNEQLFTPHVQSARSRSRSLSAPSIHMDNQTRLCSFNTKHSLFVWFTAFLLTLFLPIFPPPPPLSHAATPLGFSRHFRFSLFAFWWGDTRHIVESGHPGGILIEAGVSESGGNRERPRQGRETETGWDKGGSENERLSSKEIEWEGVWARQREQSAMEI